VALMTGAKPRPHRRMGGGAGSTLHASSTNPDRSTLPNGRMARASCPGPRTGARVEADTGRAFERPLCGGTLRFMLLLD
jgi:hypothetical protein